LGFELGCRGGGRGEGKSLPRGNREKGDEIDSLLWSRWRGGGGGGVEAEECRMSSRIEGAIDAGGLRVRRKQRKVW